MPATVKCLKCGRQAHARILEDDPSTNAFECEPAWIDEDRDEPTTCEHEEWEVLEVFSDPPELDDVI